MIVGTHFLWGHSTVFRKSALESVGLYRENLKTNAEDSYISRKLTSAGFTLIYHPEAIVDHLRVDTLESLMDNFRRHTFYGYRSDINLGSTAWSIGNYAVGLFPRFLAEDIQTRQFDCAALTCRIICQNVMANLRHYVLHRGQKSMFTA
jgi:cellulose synthase/poly-beta-1,6-N-acetylglucosamine synthase-like glycosyltransferase